MGKILVVQGTDYSNNPNAVNIFDFPAVDDGILGVYTGKGSQTSAEDMIKDMPPVYGKGASFKDIAASSTSPVYPHTSSYFKSNIIYNFKNPNILGGLVYPDMEIDLQEGITVTVFFKMTGVTTDNLSQRCIFAIEDIYLRLYANSPSGQGHLAFGPAGSITYYDVGYHGFDDSPQVVSMVLKRNEVILYRNGLLLGTANISGRSLPASLTTNFNVMSNWNGAQALNQGQLRQIQIHNRELSLAEIQSTHSILPSLLK